MPNPTTPTSLLPCPFCGSLNIDDEQGETYRWRRAYCVDCGVRGGEVRCQVTGSGANTRALAEARAAAFEEWNRRASPAPQELPPVQLPEPVAWVIDLECDMRGFIDAMAWSEDEFTTPLYTADQLRAAIAADRLACAKARGE